MPSHPVAPELLLRQLRWRYATKKFAADQKIPAEDWRALEEALVLTPSAYGLQPWRFVIITNLEKKRQLLPCSWHQAQVVDCSHLVVFAVKQHLGHREIESHLRRIAEVRGVPLQSLDAFRQLMVEDLVVGPRRLDVNAWACHQIYIALGNFLTSAALLGIDTCPIEGFEPEQYDRLLGLTDRKLSAVVVCAAGYRAADDAYAHRPKVRFEKHQVIEFL